MLRCKLEDGVFLQENGAYVVILDQFQGSSDIFRDKNVSEMRW